MRFDKREIKLSMSEAFTHISSDSSGHVIMLSEKFVEWAENESELFSDYAEKLIDKDDKIHISKGEFEVCETCRGLGTVVHPAIDSQGLTQEDFQEDPEFREDYFTGKYDIQCPDCNGLRVTFKPVFDEFLKELINKFENEEYQYALELARERYYGY